jgi:hypothetical protein
MSVYERISALVSLTLFGLLFLFFIRLPARAFSFVVLGSLLSVELSERWLMAVLLVGMACAGTDTVMRLHPTGRRGDLPHTFLFWILPGFVALVSVLLLPLAPTRELWAGGLATAGLLLAGVVLAEYHTADPVGRHYELARQSLNIVTYVVALILFIAVYQMRIRSIISATSLFAVGGLLAIELLRAEPERLSLTWLYAALIGLIMGETTWSLNYWRANGLAGGLMLLVMFYYFTGLAQQRVLGRLTWRGLIEYTFIAALGLILVFYYAFP